MSEQMVAYGGPAAIDRPATAVEIRAQVNLIQEVMASVMQSGHHYGKIPGCDKPSLWKPGAEKLFLTFRVGVRQFVEDLSTDDTARYRVRAEAFNAISGETLGDAYGECSSGEDKHRWRRVVCEEEWAATAENMRRTKWAKDYKGKVYSVKQIRTNPADVANTVLKMAAKRAEVALALRVTAASDIFTQDIEDMPEELREAVGQDDRPAIQPPQRKAKPEALPKEPANGDHEGELLAGAVIAAVSVKSGERDGKPYTKYGVKIGDNWYTTFSDTLGELAQECKERGCPVNLWWIRKGDFVNVTALEPC